MERLKKVRYKDSKHLSRSFYNIICSNWKISEEIKFRISLISSKESNSPVFLLCPSFKQIQSARLYSDIEFSFCGIVKFPVI